MRKRHWARRAGALLALALFVGLSGCLAQLQGPTEVVRACKPSDEAPKKLTELASISARPAALFAQVGLKGDEFAFLNLWRANVGIPIAEVDTFCVVCLGENERALLVRSTKDICQGNVMMACQAGDPIPGKGPKVYTGKSGLAVHFLEPTLALITDSPETMKYCLKNLPMLKGHLKDASKHHITAWAKATAFNSNPNGHFLGCPATRHGPVLHTAGKVAPRWKAEGQNDPDAVCLLGMQSGRLTIDVGATAEVHCQVDFADAKSAKKGAAALNVYNRLVRGAMLVMLGQFQLMTLPDNNQELSAGVGEDQKALLRAIPIDFLLAIEKALQDLSVKAKGKQVCAKASIPVVGHLPALGKFLTFVDKHADKAEVRPGFFFNEKTTALDLPSGDDLPPPAEPTQPLRPTALHAQPIGTAALPWIPGPPSADPLIRTDAQVPPDVPRKTPTSIVPTKRPKGPPVDAGVKAPPVPPSSLLPPPPPSTRASKAKLTVGNLLSESAAIFRIDKGKLTFLHKVRAGEAADLQVETGQRLIAVFMSEPYSATRTVTAEKQDWVIRPIPGRPTTGTLSPDLLLTPVAPRPGRVISR